VVEESPTDLPGVIHVIFAQIFDTINNGLLVIDREMTVKYWNRWMAMHSGISAEKIVGSSLFSHFPELDQAHFRRNCKSVFQFGNFCYFSQRLHKYLFPMPAPGSLADSFDYMQQSCSMGPLRNQNNTVEMLYISVQDVTEVVSYQKKLVAMNHTDQLTGVYNRNYMEGHLAKEIERCRRYDHEMSLLMIDVDLFKTINDSYGHPCGDYALKAICERITANIRKSDSLIRYGGDEFCIIMPETSEENAYKVAETIRKSICDHPFTFGGISFETTISIGVAVLDQSTDDVENMLKKADEALYTAKKSGRNSVT
jgi:diguanylate cyclase (GGDEF)-like protein